MGKLSHRRGLSLATVMALVGVVTVMAAGMTAACLTSLNYTQGYVNSDTAQLEAESGLVETVAQVVANEDFGPGQTLRSTKTPGADPQDTFHVVTFVEGTEFPHSTNAKSGSMLGYGDRTVPSGTVRVISTGVCRGQIRTCEAIVEQPPYPMGLATDGNIVSTTPIVVRGTSGVTGSTYPEDCPGHLLANGSVDIQQSGTNISGYIQAGNTIQVLGPATVRYGLRPHSQHAALPSLQLSDYRPSTYVQMVDTLLSTPQVLDSAYISDHSITYDEGFDLRNGLLFVQGDLTVNANLTGTGAIICTGDVHINCDAALDGSNWVALLAGGEIVMRGSGNYFQGLVYSEKSLDAQNIIIVGNSVVHPPAGSSNSGDAHLKNVSVVAQPSTHRVITVAGPGQVQKQTGQGNAPFGLQATSQGVYPYGGPNGPRADYPANAQGEIRHDLQTQFDGLWTSATSGGSVAVVCPTSLNSEIQSVLDAFDKAGAVAIQASLLYKKIQDLGGVSSPESAVQNAQGRILGLQEQIALLKIEFDALSRSAADAYVDYYESHTNADGSVGSGRVGTGSVGTFNFQVNTFLPRSERVRVTYCRYTNGKL